MARALRLARKGRHEIHPNPLVGCVLTRGAEIVAEGWHRRFGGPHAEVEALRRAGDKARGATAYVTLEPCAHHGKTPPCAEALIDAGVARVVVALGDPNPLVAGQGIARLAEAGVEVSLGAGEAAAREQNAPFLTYIRKGRPWVTLKAATTLDGKIADSEGRSQWITGAPARAEGHRLRRAHRAVLTGIGTVLADDPRMNVRAVPPGRRPPVRVVLDSQLRLPLDAALVRDARETPTLVLTLAATDSDRALALQARGIEVARLPAGPDGHVELNASLGELARRELSPVLLEAGGALSSAFLKAGLVDEVALFLAPMILGSPDAQPAIDLGMGRSLAQGLRLKKPSYRRLGDDMWVRGRLETE